MEELPEIKLIRANGSQTRGETRFGGKPTVICGEFNEECCGQRMVLLAQLDELDFPEAKLPGRLMVYLFISSA